ncbi:hypothetical protein CRE_13795, partial [Caenorhabditis remanei]
KPNSFNQEASDSLNPTRKIPDSREPPCRDVDYSTIDMKPTTVIITYHNEARSSLLRTVFSVFNMSPESLLTEIVLVDDNSIDVDIGKELAQIERVKVLRNNQREGLIRSRVKGAQVAEAPILTFLDSHIECNQKWLEPLLARIAENPKAVVAPIIDVINVDNFNYVGASADLRGGGNTRRAAEVWMDEYKAIYLKNVPSARFVNYGDISDRLAIRDRLQCKSFKWYLDTVYPQLVVPKKTPGKSLQMKMGHLCLDSMARKEDDAPGLFACHGTGGNQEWVFDPLTKTFKNAITQLCLDFAAEKKAVLMVKCEKDPNNRIRYRLLSAGGLEAHFNVNAESGLITLARPIDAFAGEKITLRIEGADSGMPPLSSTTTVLINVVATSSHLIPDASPVSNTPNEGELQFSLRNYTSLAQNVVKFGTLYVITVIYALRPETMVMEKNGWLTQGGMCLTVNQGTSGEWLMFGSHCDLKNGAQRWIFEKLDTFE